MKRDIPILQIVMIAMLCIAMLPLHTYGYYVALKFVVCGGCGYLATRAFSANCIGWVWLLGIVAVLYNPIVRFPLGRSVWTIVNIATIAVLVAQLIAGKGRNR